MLRVASHGGVLAPVCYGKRFGKAHHAGKEMIFPGVDGLFGRVRAMDVRWSVLDACLFGGDKSFNIFGSFIVEFMEERFEAVKSEPGVDLAIGAENSSFKQFLMICIGAIDVKDNNICVAAVGCDGGSGPCNGSVV
jgi:hypothetical protein